MDEQQDTFIHFYLLKYLALKTGLIEQLDYSLQSKQLKFGLFLRDLGYVHDRNKKCISIITISCFPDNIHPRNLDLTPLNKHPRPFIFFPFFF